MRVTGKVTDDKFVLLQSIAARREMSIYKLINELIDKLLAEEVGPVADLTKKAAEARDESARLLAQREALIAQMATELQAKRRKEPAREKFPLSAIRAFYENRDLEGARTYFKRLPSHVRDNVRRQLSTGYLAVAEWFDETSSTGNEGSKIVEGDLNERGERVEEEGARSTPQCTPPSPPYNPTDSPGAPDAPDESTPEVDPGGAPQESTPEVDPSESTVTGAPSGSPTKSRPEPPTPTTPVEQPKRVPFDEQVYLYVQRNPGAERDKVVAHFHARAGAATITTDVALQKLVVAGRIQRTETGRYEATP